MPLLYHQSWNFHFLNKCNSIFIPYRPTLYQAWYHGRHLKKVYTYIVLSSRTLGASRGVGVRPSNTVIPSVILEGWAQCFRKAGSWESWETFTEEATTESDFQVWIGFYHKRKGKIFSPKGAWEKLWDGKGKEPLGKKVFCGAEAEGRGVDSETSIAARTERTSSGM